MERKEGCAWAEVWWWRWCKSVVTGQVEEHKTCRDCKVDARVPRMKSCLSRGSSSAHPTRMPLTVLTACPPSSRGPPALGGRSGRAVDAPRKTTHLGGLMRPEFIVCSISQAKSLIASDMHPSEQATRMGSHEDAGSSVRWKYAQGPCSCS